MARAKKKSGAQRRREKQQEERTAARPASYEAAYRKAWKRRVGAAPTDDLKKGFKWLAKALLFQAEQCQIDPGIPPESRREQLARLAPQVVKALQPEMITGELEDVYERLTGSGKITGGKQDASGAATPTRPTCQ